MISFLKKILGINSDFKELFFDNEYAALAGRSNRTILALIAILFCTLTALGFALGSRENLEVKMDNPFTNWVNLPIYSSKITEQTYDIERRYESQEIKDDFFLKNIKGYSEFYLKFYHQEFIPGVFNPDTLLFFQPGRTIEPEEALLEKILDSDSDQLIWHHPELNVQEPDYFEGYRIIITDDMADLLGYKSYKTINHLLLNDEPEKNSEPIFLFLEVIAVVDELPDNASFICHPKLYNVINAKSKQSYNCYNLVERNEDGNTNFRFLSPGNVDGKKIEEEASGFFNIQNAVSCSVEKEIQSGERNQNIHRLSFFPRDKPTLDSVKLFIKAVKNKMPIVELAILQNNPSKCNMLSSSVYHNLAFHFDKLDNIRMFKEDLSENFEIDIDMNQVEAKENFALVSRLTLIVSSILLGFGILSIVLFVNNLLRTHLYQVRSNLGTFQAFGLNNDFLHRIYLKIIGSFLILSIIVSSVFVIAVDRIEQAIMTKESQFVFFDEWIGVAVIGFIVISLFIASKTIRNILGDTPGNLIYER